MRNVAVDKLLEIEEFMRTDESYRQLTAEHEILNARFLEMLDDLEKEQQDLILDYLGC